LLELLLSIEKTCVTGEEGLGWGRRGVASDPLGTGKPNCTQIVGCIWQSNGLFARREGYPNHAF